MKPEADTYSLRPATGLETGARDLMLRVVGEVADLGPDVIVGIFFRDRFGGPDDYLQAVETVWGEGVRYSLAQRVYDAQADAEMPLDFRRSIDPATAAAQALLRHMPEPDFRTAIAETLSAAHRMDAASERITKICRSRGIPWALEQPAGFVFTGDEEIERELVRPAVAAIGRPEFSGGVRKEFEHARAELATGTPEALKQAVHEAACAVESAMQVVLDKHGVAYDERDAAFKLFERLEGAGIVPREMQSIVLGAATPRNKKGGHGAGAVAHRVSASEAESVVAAAAGAIAYLATKLP